jgi:putative SOS response-associated peptidase YedK
MCGRFAQQRPAAELAVLFAAEPVEDEPGPRYNVAPTDEALVVVQRDDRRAVRSYRWGLIPHWTGDLPGRTKAFNARAEGISASPLFRDSFRRKRCLVPVDLFYEWRREETVRQPFVIERADGGVLALAGLWSSWRDPSTEQVVRSFTIVTTRANQVIAELHDRMPVVLEPGSWDLWLGAPDGRRDELRALLEPNESAALRLFPVSRLVNDVRNDGPELILPLGA